MPLKLDYFYGGEAEQYSFYRIPKVLFTDQNYSTMTMEARVLYGLLLDRMGLSARNGWLDSCGRVFIYFTLEDAMAQMGFGHNKAVRHFKELEDIGLIERKKQGQGKPTRIYVKNFILPPEPGHSPPSPEAPPQTSQKRKSALPSATQEIGQTSQIGKSALPGAGSQDFPKINANNTEINKTEMNDTELSIPPSAPAPPVRQPVGQTRQADRIDRMDAYREIIRENIDYDILLRSRFGCTRLMLPLPFWGNLDYARRASREFLALRSNKIIKVRLRYGNAGFGNILNKRETFLNGAPRRKSAKKDRSTR